MITKNYELCLNIELNTESKTLLYIIDENNKIPLEITELESKIIIFEQEVKGWLFNSMKELLESDINFISTSSHSVSFKHGIFILFGIFSYIEKMQHYRGDKCLQKNQKFCSGYLIKNGIKRIFSTEPTIQNADDDLLVELVNKTRNNLMHEAMIDDDVLFNYASNEFNSPISIHETNQHMEIRISPMQIYTSIVNDFEDYMNILRDKTSNEHYKKLQDSFIEKFDSVYKYEISILTGVA